MNPVERLENLMSFKPIDRLPIIEWAGYWDETLDHWYNEGLPKELTDDKDIKKYFDLDQYLQLWIAPRDSTCPEPSSPFAGIVKNEKDYEEVKKHLYPKSFDKSLLKSWTKSWLWGKLLYGSRLTDSSGTPVFYSELKTICTLSSMNQSLCKE